ncbi:DUF3106 domain-containing protein [Duganella qianjiadongensis]|uniref:DUF3106 domain-containing protein n=1 Tax=Duganella qianjiadongensis TaxID=2692176 RepID=A0ABW9VRX6_9BURK|nr:DUF3106 domain-containing protein [Duganella qianjiadongensis]MYM41895.1 DUF3106 domain-containing protein [Duganella qianjiadongensis]
MALSRQAKWGSVALVLILGSAAGLLWFGNQPDAPPAIAQPLAKAGSALGVAGKGSAADKTRWKDLTPQQQQTLAPLAAEWDQMEPLRRQKWLGIIKRYASMNADEQARVQERMREWVKLTPDERRQVRQNFARAKKIDPSQKNTQWESYQQLSDDEKKELAAKAALKPQVANLPTAAQSKMKTVAPIKPLVVTENGSASAPALPPPAPAPLLPASNVVPPASGAAGSTAGANASGAASGSAAGTAGDSAPIPNASNVTPAPAPAAAQPTSSNVK